MGVPPVHFRYKTKNHHAHNRSALEKYIKASINPTTPEEWEIALKNPASPVFKLFWSLVEERAANLRMIEILMERHASIAYEEKQKEKGEMLKDEISRAELLEKRLREQEQNMAKVIDHHLEDISLKDLKKLAQTLPLQIKKLEKKSTELKTVIVQYAAKINDVQKRMEARQAIVVNHYVQQLQEHPAQFVSINTGQPIALSDAGITSIQDNLNQAESSTVKSLAYNPEYRKHLHQLAPAEAQQFEANRKNMMALLKIGFAVNNDEGHGKIPAPSFYQANKQSLKHVPQCNLPKSKREKGDEEYADIGEILSYDKEKLTAEEELQKNEVKRIIKEALVDRINNEIQIQEKKHFIPAKK